MRQTSGDIRWPIGNGEMVERFQTFDWSTTALGPTEQWPQSLRTAVELMVSSDLPIALLWGPNAIALYNDAFRALAGEHHPLQFGRSYAATEPDLRASWERVSRGETVTRSDQHYRLKQDGVERESWFTHAANPLRNDQGEIVGSWGVFVETTDRVIAERQRTAIETKLRASEAQLAFLLKLSDILRPLTDPIEIQTAAARVLSDELSADWTFFAELDSAQSLATIRHDDAAHGGASFIGVYQVGEIPGLVTAMKRGEPVLIADLMTTDATNDAPRQRFSDLGIKAIAVVPMMKQERAVAAVVVMLRTTRAWSAPEVAMMTETARRTWDAIERARAEIALQENQASLRAIVEEATDYAIFTTDASRRIETWLPGARAVFGWSADEAIGQSSDILFTPEDREAGVPEAEFTTALVSGYASDVRWHLHKDGSRVFIEGSVRARRGTDGAFAGLLKIGQDTTERSQAEHAQREIEARIREELATRVAEATAELRTLSRRILTVQEEERRHLSRELHDEIGQTLTGLGLQLGMKNTPDTNRLAEARRIVSELTDQIRQLSMDLRPSVLDAYGLLAALTWQRERLERRTGLMIDLRHEGLDRRLPPDIEITAYRIVQEALTNVARHSMATIAVVQILAEDSMLTVSVRDDGRGFDPASMVTGSGIGGMRERIELIGGTLTIDAAEGQGVVVTAELPIDEL